MPIIPHAHWFFDAAGLLLGEDTESAEWQMTVDEAVRYVEAIGEFAKVDRRERTGVFAAPLPVLLLGGEPISRFDALEVVLKSINAYGLAAEVSTTADWVRDRAQVVDVLTALRPRVYALRLCTDVNAISGEGGARVELLLDAARSVGIVVDIHCAVAPSLPVPRSLLALEVVNNNSSFIHFDAAYDAPRGEDPDGFYLPVPSRQRCAEKFGFYVTPGGSVYPCLAGAGFAALRIGDLSREGVADIVRAATTDASVERLREQGPHQLYLELPAEQRSGQYTDNCDFHRQLLRRAE